MRIIYISSSCSDEMYKWVCRNRTIQGIEPQQKFNRLLIDGLSTVKGVKVECISSLPLSSTTSNIKKFEGKTEVVSESLIYNYIPFINGKISRYVSLMNNTEKYVVKSLKKHRSSEVIIITDVLNFFMLRNIFKHCKRHNVPIYGIITDLPTLTTNMKGRQQNVIRKFIENFFQKRCLAQLAKYDGYITLTESIYDALKQPEKPHIVVEGSVDSTIGLKPDCHSDKFIIVYAGGLFEKYGVGKLAEACIRLGSKCNFEMRFYGDGPFSQKLRDIESKYPYIQYRGMASLEQIVTIEQESNLLVNPRPSDEEFSKFSFPSKTLEYMGSGTPLLTTKLPGIPSEYFDYCFIIDDESVKGIEDKIFEIIQMNETELKALGEAAQKFVVSNKSNISQAHKIHRFITTQNKGL